MQTGSQRDGRDRVGVVAIGRNEGERLVRCLDALVEQDLSAVYVDSGSSDGSLAEAETRRVDTVLLDSSKPFTAARGRNTGFARLLDIHPDVEYVQFIDGDCELRDGWVAQAMAYLDKHPEVAIVAGRRRERFPDASPYNALIDMEWDTPIGEATEIGGDALIRASVFRSVGGYDETLIAGEDPDLCFRVRRAGFCVRRIDVEMTLHDADLHTLRQWWRRNVRSGHAYAEGAHMHGATEDRYRRKELRSLLFWGGALPAASMLFAPLTLGGSAALGASGYALLWSKVFRHRVSLGADFEAAALYATGVTAGKLAEMQGAAQYVWTRFVRRERSSLIEYKGPKR